MIVKTIIKRDGSSVNYDPMKIITAVTKANNAVPDKSVRMSDLQIRVVEETVRKQIENTQTPIGVEDIQTKVIHAIMAQQAYDVAQVYTEYRYRRSLVRKANSTDDAIMSLIDNTNDEMRTENANKNIQIISTQRDYIAGIVSRDITWRKLLPDEIAEAQKAGIIHFHDADYFLQHSQNCCLVNLCDMLSNGTLITDTLIETPKSLSSAANIATQIVAQVASNQYGGQTISLAHLAPFVDVSRKKFRKKFIDACNACGMTPSEEQIESIVNAQLKDEIRSSIQTIQYQLLTLMTTNGQTPFVSMSLDLKEAKAGQERNDMALLIEEVFNQRIYGIKNRNGDLVTPAFPKLLYFLSDINAKPDTPFYYLTELAAKCTAKRMVPDYISEKVMLKLKGDTYPCMGCVDGNEVITYQFSGKTYVESFERMWDRMSDVFDVKVQPNGNDLYIDTPGVKIYDQKNGFVDNLRVIRNLSTNWMQITFNNGRTLKCTADHPFETENQGVVLAQDLTPDDVILADKNSAWPVTELPMKNDRAWLYGFLLCDATYYDNVTASIADTHEDEIETKFVNVVEHEFGLSTKTTLQNRNEKGVYKDLRIVSDANNALKKLKINLISKFEGKAKRDRHIPNDVFSWPFDAKIHFIAGMIDANGYVNTTMQTTRVQIGSTNKELAIQQALLAQSVGMRASIYLNKYRAKCAEKTRYRVEFVPTEELLDAIEFYKKKGKNIQTQYKNHAISQTDTLSVSKMERLNETAYSYDVTTASEHFTVSGIYSHNCRSFLTPWHVPEEKGNISNAKDYTPGEHRYYGRFNQGVVTINLVDVALSSGKNMDEFWRILNERLELCHRALRIRHEHLLGTLSDVAPILYQFGAIARLKPGETIDKLLYDGYSTLSLGYAGVYEMTLYMTGESHTSPNGRTFATNVMKALNNACDKWKSAENIDYSIYGTPIESTTYTFAKKLRTRFGTIEGITDHDYITNSYHVNVREKIDAFDKLSMEAEFQELSPGGAVSYVEAPNLTENIPAVLKLIDHIYEHIMYAEINIKSDHCQACGYDGEIQIITDEAGKLAWKCPNCGCTDQKKMNVARRTCGYIGTQWWNQGRTQEIRDRVTHVSVEKFTTD